jgi:tetratricopeptide (TPR) repeat protein
MDKKRYKALFRKLINMKHGMEVDFYSIEQKLKHLREGGSLIYEDLETIADDKCWPFNEYWMWPSKEQIEDKLKITDGLFVELPNKEEEALSKLLYIFKNLSLVSIVLRFVRPRYYAIYSRPPLYLLRIERGKDDIEEYMNYIDEMRLLRKSFEEFRTAEADMIVWAIAEETRRDKKSYKGKEILDEFIKLLAEVLPENLTIEELISHHAQNPLKIAEIYYERKQFKTAGMWAGRAFEKYVKNQCDDLWTRASRYESDQLFNMVESICSEEDNWFKKDVLHRLRKLRNKAMHVDRTYSQSDAKYSIEELKRLG